MRLKDQVAIVTGGGGGIGEGICLCLAREGAHVVVSDLQMDLAEPVASKVKEAGQRAFAVQTDVREAEQCQNLIDESLREMGRIDILVCCAGVSGLETWGEKTFTLENISDEEWNLTIDVNLKGVFLCNRAIAPYFKEQKRGKIINISSVAGHRPVHFVPHYSATKAGVIVLSQAVALLLARYNVNVNTVCPGFIWTPMWEKMATTLIQSHPAYRDMSPEEVFKSFVKRVPMRDPQTPEGIGNAVVFLASEEAKEITGQAISVDGGMSV